MSSGLNVCPEKIGTASQQQEMTVTMIFFEQ
jgi:hypothetical protein